MTTDKQDPSRKAWEAKYPSLSADLRMFEERAISALDAITARHSWRAWDGGWQASREQALTDAMQAAGPEDSHQDEWFKAKADSYRRIKELLK